jgi:hypothetical protein
MNGNNHARKDPDPLIKNLLSKIEDGEDKKGSENEGNQNPCLFRIRDEKVGEGNQGRIKRRGFPPCPVPGQDQLGMTDIFSTIIMDDFGIKNEREP